MSSAPDVPVLQILLSGQTKEDRSAVATALFEWAPTPTACEVALTALDRIASQAQAVAGARAALEATAAEQGRLKAEQQREREQVESLWSAVDSAGAQLQLVLSQEPEDSPAHAEALGAARDAFTAAMQMLKQKLSKR